MQRNSHLPRRASQEGAQERMRRCPPGMSAPRVHRRRHLFQVRTSRSSLESTRLISVVRTQEARGVQLRRLCPLAQGPRERGGSPRVGNERAAAAEDPRRPAARRRHGLHRRAQLQVGLPHQRAVRAEFWTRAAPGVPILQSASMYHHAPARDAVHQYLLFL